MPDFPVEIQHPGQIEVFHGIASLMDTRPDEGSSRVRKQPSRCINKGLNIVVGWP